MRRKEMYYDYYYDIALFSLLFPPLNRFVKFSTDFVDIVAVAARFLAVIRFHCFCSCLFWTYKRSYMFASISLITWLESIHSINCSVYSFFNFNYFCCCCLFSHLNNCNSNCHKFVLIGRWKEHLLIHRFHLCDMHCIWTFAHLNLQ